MASAPSPPPWASLQKKLQALLPASGLSQLAFTFWASECWISTVLMLPGLGTLRAMAGLTAGTALPVPPSPASGPSCSGLQLRGGISEQPSAPLHRQMSICLGIGGGKSKLASRTQRGTGDPGSPPASGACWSLLSPLHGLAVANEPEQPASEVARWVLSQAHSG